jgi:hypothetical protein
VARWRKVSGGRIEAAIALVELALGKEAISLTMINDRATRAVGPERMIADDHLWPGFAPMARAFFQGKPALIADPPYQPLRSRAAHDPIDRLVA